MDENAETLPTEAEQLRRRGLRAAKPGEAGWYVRVLSEDSDGRYSYQMWATDLADGE